MDFSDFFSCHPEVGRTPSKQFHKVFPVYEVITKLWCQIVLEEWFIFIQLLIVTFKIPSKKWNCDL